MLTASARKNDKDEASQTSKKDSESTVLMSVSVSSLIITGYQPIFIPGFSKEGGLRIAIRSYSYGNEPFLVTVDPYSFSTECLPVTHFSHRKIVKDQPKPVAYTMKELEVTPYLSALVKYTSQPYKLQNYGLTQADTAMEGVILTVDMCPSVKPFEADFFKELAAYSEEPTPVAICMTGMWLIQHADEFNWLIQQEKSNKLKITWVNHSFSHVYYADLTSQSDLERNFLLAPWTNLRHELMEVEQLLIKNYQSPSVFFRAPGLVTNEGLVKKLNKYGLIPVGSEAWLAKGEEAKNGSVILVHGNSNEPAGIEKMRSLLGQKKFRLFPLTKAFLSGAELKAESSDKLDVKGVSLANKQ